MLAGQSIAGITKPEVKTVEPKPAAPAPAPVVEPPAPKPVKATEKAPVAAAPKEAEPKAEPKVESAPAPAPEAPATPVVETSEEKLNFDVIISRRISGCTFDKKETDTTNVTTFKDANNKGVLIVGVAKETGNFKLKSRKGEVVLMKDAAETEFQEALDKLL
jgi:outer membrane biosynthesis protein TonB